MLEPHLCDQAMCMSVVGKHNVFLCRSGVTAAGEDKSMHQSEHGRKTRGGRLTAIDRRHQPFRALAGPTLAHGKAGPAGTLRLHFLIRDRHCPLRDGAKLSLGKVSLRVGMMRLQVLRRKVSVFPPSVYGDLNVPRCHETGRNIH